MLLSDPEDPTSRKEIQRLNKKIKKQNQIDRLADNKFLINNNVLRSIGTELKSATLALEQKPDSSKARESLEKLERQLDTTIRSNFYPKKWLDFLKENRKSENKEPEGKASLASKSDESQKQKLGLSEKDENMKMGEDISRDKDVITDQDIRMDEDPEPPSNPKADRLRGKHSWNPGQTRKGEDILGYRPFEKTDRRTNKKYQTGFQFIIEKKGQPNPVALVSGEEIGDRARDAYLDLPEEKKVDIRYTENKYTHKNAGEFDYIIGFACKPFQTKTIGSGAYYPAGYAYYKMTDGTKCLVSRTAMRKIFGMKDADDDIAEFYEQVKETPPWLIKPKSTKSKRLTDRPEGKNRHNPRKYTSSEDETEDESDSSSIFLSNRNDDSSDQESSGDDGFHDRRKPRRGMKNKRKSAPQITQSESRNDLSEMIEQFMKKSAEENKRQIDSLIKVFQDALRQIPVPTKA